MGKQRRMRRHSSSAKARSSLEVMKKRNSTDCTSCGDDAHAATPGPSFSNSSFPPVTPLEVLRKIFVSKPVNLDPPHMNEGKVAPRSPKRLSPRTVCEVPPCFPKTLSLSELRERLGVMSSENSRKGGDNVDKPPESAPDSCELNRNSSACSASSSVLGAPPLSPKKVLMRKLSIPREYITHSPRNEKGRLKFSNDSMKDSTLTSSSSSSSSVPLAVPTPRKKPSLLDLLRAGGIKHLAAVNKRESPEESDDKKSGPQSNSYTVMPNVSTPSSLSKSSLTMDKNLNPRKIGSDCGPPFRAVIPCKVARTVVEEGKRKEEDSDTNKYSFPTSRGMRNSSEKRVENHGGPNTQTHCGPSLSSSLSLPVQDPNRFSATGKMAYPVPHSVMVSSSAHCRHCPQRNGEADTSANVIPHEASTIRPTRRRNRSSNSDSDIDSCESSSTSSSSTNSSSPSRVRRKRLRRKLESPPSRKNDEMEAEEKAKNEMTQGKAHRLDSGSRFLVFDTSSLIRADIGILNMCSEKYTVCIPYAVLHEIDMQIKHGSFGRRPASSDLRPDRPGGTISAVMSRPFNPKFSLTDDQLKGQAMKVRDWIYGAQQSNRGIRVQKRSEVNETYFRSALSNDDHILGYAVFLKDEHIHPTFFITDDKLLATKAVAELGRGAVYNYESLRAQMGVRVRGNF